MTVIITPISLGFIFSPPCFCWGFLRCVNCFLTTDNKFVAPAFPSSLEMSDADEVSTSLDQAQEELLEQTRQLQETDNKYNDKKKQVCASVLVKC